MNQIETFEVGGASYKVVRASAIQQDEILSHLTQPLVRRLMSADADEEMLLTTFLAMPFAMKQRIDALMLSRITLEGETRNLTIKDFDGKVMEYNRLRAKVLLWNLSDFFDYWASVKDDALAQANQQMEQEQAA